MLLGVRRVIARNMVSWQEDRAKFPWALPKNLWPKEIHKMRSLTFNVKEIPELEKHCKDLGKVMQEVRV